MSGGTLQRVDVSLIDQTSRFGGGFTTRVDAYAVAAEEGLTEVHWIRILAMAAGDEWPDLEGLNPETIALPDAYSNVENGGQLSWRCDEPSRLLAGVPAAGR